MADIVIVFWAIICLYGIKYCKGKNYYEDYMSKENILMLKGIFSIVVILHHISQRFKPVPKLFSYFAYAGPWAVMFFFFASGYGLLLNYVKKENYDNNFLIKRFKNIIPVYVFAVVIYWIVNVLTGNNYSIKELPRLMVANFPIVDNSWFIIIISIFYIIFYLEMKICKLFEKNSFNCTMIIIIPTIVLCFVLIKINSLIRYGSWWTDYIFSFPFGMLWSLFKEKIDKIVKDFYWPILLFVFSLFIISWLRPINGNIFYYLFYCGGSIYRESLFFPILVVIITMKFKIGNRFLNYLGKISYETYVFHGIFSNHIFYKTSLPSNNPILYILFSIMFSIIFASIVHNIFNTGYSKKIENQNN